MDKFKESIAEEEERIRVEDSEKVRLFLWETVDRGSPRSSNGAEACIVAVKI